MNRLVVAYKGLFCTGQKLSIPPTPPPPRLVKNTRQASPSLLLTLLFNSLAETYTKNIPFYFQLLLHTTCWSNVRETKPCSFFFSKRKLCLSISYPQSPKSPICDWLDIKKANLRSCPLPPNPKPPCQIYLHGRCWRGGRADNGGD